MSTQGINQGTKYLFSVPRQVNWNGYITMTQETSDIYIHVLHVGIHSNIKSTLTRKYAELMKMLIRPMKSRSTDSLMKIK